MLTVEKIIMIEILADYAKKFFDSIRGSVRIGLTNKAIFKSLYDPDYKGIWTRLKSDISKIRSFTEQNDRFKYIRKDRIPTDKFYQKSDRVMYHDKWSYFKVKGKVEVTGEQMELIVKLYHDDIQTLTRGQLEERCRIEASEKYDEEYRLRYEGMEVRFDFGTRRK